MLSAATRSLLMTQPQTGIRQLTLSAGVGTDAERKAALEGDGLPMVSGLSVYPAATNLCANGGFETNTTGWGLNGAGVQSQTRITTDSVFGVACNEVVVDGAVAGQGLFWSGTKPTTTPGAAYTLSAYVKSVSGATTLLLVIDWYQADGTTYISTSSTTATITTVWARYSFTATAPALGARAVIGPRNNNAAASTMRIDGVQFEEGSVATPYIETDGASAARVAGRAQLPVQGLFSSTQGGIIARARAGAAHASLSAAAAVFSWGDDADNLIQCNMTAANPSVLQITRRAAAVGAAFGAQSAAIVADTGYTPAIAWTSGFVRTSLNGAAWTQIADTNIPAIAATSCELFENQITALRHLLGNARWAIACKGTLSDADVALSWVTQDAVPTLRQIELLSKGSKPTCLIPGRMTDAILLPAYYGLL